MVKCNVCKQYANGKLIVKDKDLHKLSEPKEYTVCHKCFQLWIREDFDELTSRWENAQDNLLEAHNVKTKNESSF